MRNKQNSKICFSKMKLLPLFFLQLIISQNITFYYPTQITQLGWIAWDVSGLNLFLISNGNNIICKLKGECVIISLNRDTLLVRLTTENLFIIATHKPIFFWFRIVKLDTGLSFILPENIVSFDLMAANDLYLYLNLQSKGREEMFVYSIDWSDSNVLTKVSQFPHLSTRWQVEKDGIYAFTKNETHTILTMKSPDGRVNLWSTPISFCIGSEQLLVASCFPYSYTFCSPQNSVTQINNEKYEQQINIFSVDEGKVEAIGCSITEFFVLYNDSRVVQYNMYADYVYTYIPNSKKILPRYNQLKISDGYLFYALCDYTLKTDDCPNSTIYQWKVVENFKKTIFLSVLAKEIHALIKDVPSKNYIRTLTFKNISVDQIKQNSYFNAASYNKENKTIVIYFSGSGNIPRSTIGDMFLTEISIPNDEDQLHLTSVRYIPVHSASIRPISQYASHMFEANGLNYLVFHGGISSDYKVVFSTIFSISLTNGQYETLSQSDEFS
jgi:hypothetical protein